MGRNRLRAKWATFGTKSCCIYMYIYRTVCGISTTILVGPRHVLPSAIFPRSTGDDYIHVSCTACDGISCFDAVGVFVRTK